MIALSPPLLAPTGPVPARPASTQAAPSVAGPTPLDRAQQPSAASTGRVVSDKKAALAEAVTRLTPLGPTDQSAEMIDHLHPNIRAQTTAAVQALRAAGYPATLAPQGGYRSPEEQDQLFARGRDPQTGQVVDPKKVVTGKRGGESLHNHGLAFDLVLRDSQGRPDDAASEKVAFETAKIVRRFGFSWGSDPGATSIRDDDGHYQSNQTPFHTDAGELQKLPRQTSGGDNYPDLPADPGAEARARATLREVKEELAQGRIPTYQEVSQRPARPGGNFRAPSPEQLARLGQGDRNQQVRELIDLGVRQSANVDQLRSFVRAYGNEIIPPGVRGD